MPNFVESQRFDLPKALGSSLSATQAALRRLGAKGRIADLDVAMDAVQEKLIAPLPGGP